MATLSRWRFLVLLLLLEYCSSLVAFVPLKRRERPANPATS
ncbi:hypothetical protein CIPAW_02G114200 [Carya illinoinensis]|uniref:Uncharacterized protein n=1 Tax=Carya illinoinensis TaxID=32201 RepID=A0A8T1RCP9_CARIL|nr:hypothetical protein CIPAW_02G114200 [Carya illinoinensis]